MQQVLGKKVLLAVLIFAIATGPLLLQETKAQGLKGQPKCQRGYALPSPYMPGNDDNERWQFLQKNLQSLIGMEHQAVIKLFEKKVVQCNLIATRMKVIELQKQSNYGCFFHRNACMR